MKYRFVLLGCSVGRSSILLLSTTTVVDAFPKTTVFRNSATPLGSFPPPFSMGLFLASSSQTSVRIVDLTSSSSSSSTKEQYPPGICAAMGAAFALTTRDFLVRQQQQQQQQEVTNTEGNNYHDESLSPLPPPPQPVKLVTSRRMQPEEGEHELFFGNSPLHDILQSPPEILHSNNDNNMDTTNTIWHLMMDPRTQEAISILRQREQQVSFLGLHAMDDEDPPSEDHVRYFGNLIPTLLQNNDPSTAAVSLDMSLHLSMLQYNCLPKSLANDNTWTVLVPSAVSTPSNSGILLVEYRYNPQESLGGNDPLVCPTKERFLPANMDPNETQLSPHSAAVAAGNMASAAAYTALRGSGTGSVASASIASSLGAIVCQHYSTHNNNDDNNRWFPSYTWQIIERIAQASQRQYTQVVTTENTIRRLYKESGRR